MRQHLQGSRSSSTPFALGCDEPLKFVIMMNAINLRGEVLMLFQLRRDAYFENRTSCIGKPGITHLSLSGDVFTDHGSSWTGGKERGT